MLCPHGAGLKLAHRESGRKSPEEKRAMTRSAVLSSHRTQESLASLLRKVSFVEVQHDLGAQISAALIRALAGDDSQCRSSAQPSVEEPEAQP